MRTLVKGPMPPPSEVQDLFLSFQKTMIERTIAAEMNLHLGYRPGEDKPEGQANERNGARVSNKAVYLALGVQADGQRDVLAKSVRATFDWKVAMNQFAILFGERFTAAWG